LFAARKKAELWIAKGFYFDDVLNKEKFPDVRREFFLWLLFLINIRVKHFETAPETKK